MYLDDFTVDVASTFAEKSITEICVICVQLSNDSIRCCSILISENDNLTLTSGSGDAEYFVILRQVAKEIV